MPEAAELIKLCECGCGQPTLPRARPDYKHGVRAGEPARFIRGHFKGGRFLPPAQIVAAYREGRSLGEVSEITGVSKSAVARHVRAAGAMRPPELRVRSGGRRNGQNRYLWLTAEKVGGLWRAGLSVREISDQVGVSEGTVRRRLHKAGVEFCHAYSRPSDGELKRLYEEEELDSYQIAAVLRGKQPTIYEWLVDAGVELRSHLQQRSRSSLGGLWNAFEVCRRLRPVGDLSQKQQDCLSLLEVASEALSARRISEVFRHVAMRREYRNRPRSPGLVWADWTPDGVRATCSRLEEKDLIRSAPDAGARQLVWFIPSGFDLADPEREIELRELIAEQVAEDQEWAAGGSYLSLDTTVDGSHEPLGQRMVTTDLQWWEEPAAA